jgi:hypothetical protein
MNRKNICFIFIMSLLFIFLVLTPIKGEASKNYSTDWLHNAKWGIFTHYLVEANTSASDWNNQVENFDVEYLAQQLKSIGVRYYFITIGQHSGHYCSPNAAYDRFVGVSPSKCSSRDLVSDLYKALEPRGIKLLVYLPSGAPILDSTAVAKLEYAHGPYRNKEFQYKWEAVIREWSLRWGNKVKGWWFDGVVWPKEMYSSAIPPNFKSFAQAARAGNKKSLVAFNPGIKYPIITQTEFEDYTAGELEEPWGVMCEDRWVGKAQLHILSYLGSTWGKGPIRYNSEKVIRITNTINRCGGVITWDVPIQKNGHIPESFVNQLKELNQGTKQSIKAEKPKPLKPPGNLAIYKKTKMLSLDGKRSLPVNSAKYFSQLGVDGDYSTSAMAGDEWAWTYQVDLGKVYTISQVKVTFGKTYATQYKILVSNDDKKWLEIAQDNNSNGGSHKFIFKSVPARYVSIKGLKPDGLNQNGGQMSIAELEVYK